VEVSVEGCTRKTSTYFLFMSISSVYNWSILRWS